MNTKLIAFAAFLLTLTACQEDTSIEAKKEQLKELKGILKETQNSITDLEVEIAAMDTTTIQYKLQHVAVTIAQKDTFSHFVDVHGEVEASNNVLVNPEVGGTITRIFVKEGQKVIKGQSLVSVDASVMENNLAELESQLEFATTMYDKQKRLFDQNIGSEVQYLQAKNTKESLENSIATLKSQRGKFIIKAPITGVIDEIFPHIGEAANPAMPVARVVNLDKVAIESELSEKYLGKVNKGDVVNINFKSLGVKMTGQVTQIGQFIDENNRTFKVKIDLSEENNLIKPNLLAVVEFRDYLNPAVIALPTKSILEDLKGKYVFVSSEEKIDGKMMPVARKKYVELGMYSSSKVEVFNLDEGDTVIVEGFADLAEGEKLKIVQ